MANKNVTGKNSTYRTDTATRKLLKRIFLKTVGTALLPVAASKYLRVNPGADGRI